MTARRLGGLAAASVVIAGLTLLARVVGLGRWLVFSHEVGASCVGSAYAAANTVPNVLYEVAAGGALAAVAVPIVSGYLAEDDQESADRATSALLTWALVVLVPLGVLLAVAAAPVAGLLTGAAGCDGQQALATRMLWWFAPQIPLYGVGVVAAGALQARRRFTWPALAPLLSSLVVVAAYLAYGRGAGAGSSSPSAVAVLAGGTTLGVVALSLPLLVPLVRGGARLRPTLSFPEGAAARARALAAAGLVALVAQQAAVLLTVWVAEHRGGPGVINAYQYLQAIYLLPYAVLAVPVATAVFPSLTSSSSGGSEAPPEVAARLARAIRVVTLAGSLGACVLIAVGPSAGTFFQALDAGRRTGGGLHLSGVMSWGLLAFAPGLVGYALLALLSRATYVRGRPATAARWSAVGWGVAAVVPVLAATARPGPVPTVVALGTASSAGMTLAALGLLATVRGAWGRAATGPAGRALLGAAVTIPVAGLAGRAPTRWWGAGEGVVDSILIGAACAALAATCWAVVAGLADRQGLADLARRVTRR